ncbi:MAG: adenine deaminase [Methanomicrobiales archaeon]|nr:adenine deaminase [Methanomicrobiales archaeon]
MDPSLAAARGTLAADMVFRNAEIFNPFDCSWEKADLAVCDGLVVGLGESYHGTAEQDLSGSRMVPGLVDAHVHIESSLLCPAEFARAVLPRGTTTVIADPHEIANVMGPEGIEYMLHEGRATPLDILVLLPSCVPATPADAGGAVLTADDLLPFVGRKGVIGLGEMMNVPGALAADAEVLRKIRLSEIRDGHAPSLSGKDLNAYILAGFQSDHETTTLPEAREKLRRGMYLFLREGSTERNLRDLAPAVTPCTACRCSLATDDRHADLLMAEGHIDDCIRKAVTAGVELELALRMATLSPCDRFRLTDRGALAPGRLADFCILGTGQEFTVEQTYKRGKPVRERPYRKPRGIRRPFVCTPPGPDRIRMTGSGEARVIGLAAGQITTRDLRFPVDDGGIPDTGRDILTAVVCDRYRDTGCGIGPVHGFRLQEGAIAGSVSHDAHNIVAVGAEDPSLLAAIRKVIALQGGLVAVSRDQETVLALPVAGLMSLEPCDRVAARLAELDRHVERLGGIPHAFMHLSFLALTVIPALRVTPRGLFDVAAGKDVPVFPGNSSRP